MMKIGEFSDSFLPIIDGVGRVVKAYADTLSLRNQEVYVICPTDNMGFRGKYPFEIVDYNSLRLSKGNPWKVGIDKLDTHFTARMKLIDLDICHTHSPAFAGFSAVYYAKKKNVPLVGTFHSKYYDDILIATKSKMLARIGSEMVADFYSQCDEVWTVSENSAETLQSYGYKGKLIIVPNGTNVRELHTEMLDQVSSGFGIRRDVPVLLYVGQINWKKNLRRIIEGAARLKKQGHDFQLVFAGKGPDEEEVKELACKEGISDRLVMTGHLQDSKVLDCLYYLATLFVFPSLYDTFSLVVREAALMETPSVVVEGSAAGESIKNGENGLLCKDTTEDFADKVAFFLSLPEEKREQINKKAKETLPIRWDGPIMDTVIERYENLVNIYKFKNRKFN